MQKRPSDINNEENKTSVTALHSFLLSEIQCILCLNGNICCKTREIQTLSDVLNSVLKTQFKLKNFRACAVQLHENALFLHVCNSTSTTCISKVIC